MERFWTHVGASTVAARGGRTAVLAATERLSWQDVATASLPMSPGLSLQEAVRQCEIPNVRRVATSPDLLAAEGRDQRGALRFYFAEIAEKVVPLLLERPDAPDGESPGSAPEIAPPAGPLPLSVELAVRTWALEPAALRRAGQPGAPLELYTGSQYAVGPYGHDDGYGFMGFIEERFGLRAAAGYGAWPYMVYAFAREPGSGRALVLSYTEGDIMLAVYRTLEEARADTPEAD